MKKYLPLFPFVFTILLVSSVSLKAQCPENHDVNYLSDNLFINGSFEDGNSDFESDFVFRANCSPRQGQYSITESIAADCHNSYDPNFQANDRDAYFYIDYPANRNNRNIWCQTVSVSSNGTYEFSGDFGNVASALFSHRPNPVFNVIVDGSDSNIGNIFESASNIAITEGSGWHSITTTFDVLDNTEIEVCIQNGNSGGNGRDLAIDNLSIKSIECIESNTDNDDEDSSNKIDFLDCDETVEEFSASLLNGSFEEGSYFIFEDGSINIDQSQIDDWSRAAFDRNLQITDSGHNGVQAYEGNSYSRVNAISNSSIYQDIATVPGDILHYSFAHRGGAGVDQITVFFGTPKPNGQEPLTSELVNLYATNNDRWVVYEGNYEVPAGQTVTRFSLGARSSSNGNLMDGNLIDAVTVQSVQASCEAPMRGNVEVCANGFDDDGDGLIDDADPDCSTSGGNNGGLESNGRLADKIFERTLNRRIEPTIVKTKKSDMVRKKRTAQYGIFNDGLQRSQLSIEAFIPIDTLDNTETYISSPTDLEAITNATEVFSVDIFQGDIRLAAIFATATKNGVYEHTKYICDRLKGGIINDLKSERIGYADFVIADIIQPEGNREYALSFSAREIKDNKFDIQSHWSLEKYPVDEDYYNFQIWASNLEDLKKLAFKTMQLLNEYKQIQTMTTTDAPSVFVSHGEYSNGALNLKLINKKASTNITLVGEKAATETMPNESVYETANIQGAYSEFVTVEVGSVYDMGFRIKHDNDEIFDDLFIADGLWFLDTKDGDLNYEVLPSTDLVTENNYPLERSIEVNGTFDNTLNIFRSLKPNFRSVDVSDYNTLHFNVSGAQAMQIVLIKSSISEWGEQYKTSITTSSESNEVNIPLSRFSNGTEEEINLNDIQAIIFKIENEGETQSFEMKISSLDFRTQEDNSSVEAFNNTDIVVTPNPATDNVTVQWMSTEEGLHRAALLNIDGQVMREFEGLTSRGFNEIRLERQNLTDGIYFFSIIEKSGKLLSEKIVFLN